MHRQGRTERQRRVRQSTCVQPMPLLSTALASWRGLLRPREGRLARLRCRGRGVCRTSSGLVSGGSGMAVSPRLVACMRINAFGQR
jgi:hypothetical protein